MTAKARDTDIRVFRTLAEAIAYADRHFRSTEDTTYTVTETPDRRAFGITRTWRTYPARWLRNNGTFLR